MKACLTRTLERFVEQTGIPPTLKPIFRDSLELVSDIASRRERETMLNFCMANPTVDMPTFTRALARSLHSMSPLTVEDGAESQQVNAEQGGM